MGLEFHREVAMEHVALKMQHPLCCAWAVQSWKRFCVVKMLKNILCLIDVYVFLSHVGKDTLR